jgi:hypothetical protein
MRVHPFTVIVSPLHRRTNAQRTKSCGRWSGVGGEEPIPPAERLSNEPVCGAERTISRDR